ncbi:MAG: DNA-directed RNA polymerase subunit A'' [Nanoarchaeota archaeon]|nr:DNA-directed RNA polymerase subunit A'' [Nanoarchaeota archaeon]
MLKNLIEKYKDLPDNLVQDIEKIVKEQKLSSEDIKKVFKKVMEEYEVSKIVPGEAIGVVTAESFGEPGTQMILRVFHFAGVAEMSLTLGLSRLIEIFDARKIPSTPKTEVYLKKKFSSDIKTIRKIAAMIKETSLNDVVREFSTNLTLFRVEIILDPVGMRDLNVTKKQVIDSLEREDFNVKETKDFIYVRHNDEDAKFVDLFRLKEKLKKVLIKGVKGITQVLPVKMGGEFIIMCAGSNLKDIAKIEGVDEKRIVTNNLFLIAETFGIEAARNMIIKESLDVIKNEGLNIDIRHIMFLADVMTSGGVIKGITRSGITSEKESVLARACFETPIKHLIKASVTGEVDNLNSVIENILLNQNVPVGTGLPDLVAKMVGEEEARMSKKRKEKKVKKGKKKK